MQPRHFTLLTCALSSLLLMAQGVCGEPPPMSSIASDTLNGKSAIRYLVDSEENTSSNFWEWLQLPSEKSQVRARIHDVSNQEYPSHYLRLYFIRDEVSFGALITRDAGENDLADLWRVAIQRDQERLQLVAGDFRVDYGLGWTVATRAAWNSTTDALAPARFTRSGIGMNLSAEEGRGWQGLALQSSLTGDDRGTSPLLLSAWGGMAEFDARRDGNGILLPYSTQGDHRFERAVELESTLASHAGGHLTASLPMQLGQAGLSGSFTRFDEPLSPLSSNARFRFAQQELTVAGADWEWNDSENQHRLRAEAAYQSHGAWGGSIVASNQVHETLRVVASAWRGTSAFSTFQARPSLAFGSDPAGVSGGQLNTLMDVPVGVFSAGLAADWKEAEPAETEGDRRQSVFVRFDSDRYFNTRGSLSARIRQDLAASSITTTLYSARLHLIHQRDRRQIDLRADTEFNEQGASTNAVTLGLAETLSRVVGYRVAVSGVSDSGSGTLVTLVVPSGPGVFPIRRVGHDLLTVAARIDITPLSGFTLWIGSQLDRDLSESNPETTFDSSISVGLEWRDFLRE